jgi:hypothetical protein
LAARRTNRPTVTISTPPSAHMRLYGRPGAAERRSRTPKGHCFATRIVRSGYFSVTIAIPFAGLAIGVLTVRVRFPS